MEFLINFGFRKPALRLGIIRAGRDFPYSADCPAWQRPGCQWPHTLSLGPAPRSPSGICRRPALSSGPAPGGAARQDLEAPRCHWQWRRTAVAQRPPSRALPEPLSAGSNPGKLAAPQCVALLSYLEDRTGWDRFVLRASQIEPERSFVSTEANGRAFLACRLPTRLHCQLWRMHLPVSASCSRCWHVGCCRGLGAGEIQLRLGVRSC